MAKIRNSGSILITRPTDVEDHKIKKPEKLITRNRKNKASTTPINFRTMKKVCIQLKVILIEIWN